jgi:hypothetical protein
MSRTDAGFVEWPFGPVPTTRVEYLPNGGIRRTPELCRIFVKDLAAGSGP